MRPFVRFRSAEAVNSSVATCRRPPRHFLPASTALPPGLDAAPRTATGLWYTAAALRRPCSRPGRRPCAGTRRTRQGGDPGLAEVRVSENETFCSSLRRFNKKIQQSGILAEARRREHYEKPSVKRKRKEAKRKKATRQE